MINIPNLLKIFSLLLLFTGCTVKTRNGPYSKSFWEDYYKIHLSPGSKVISAGPNRTVEYVNHRYVVQEYYYDTKVVTSTKTYTDAALSTQIGPSLRHSDLGVKIYETTYKNGQIDGLASSYDRTGKKSMETFYVKGKLEGKTVLFDSTGRITTIINYHLDSLDGEKIYYAPDGSVKEKEVWQNGKLIKGESVQSFTGSQIAPAYPRNPAYAKEKNCAESSLMHYLRNTIHYPANARELGIQGTAAVSFVVDKDGSIKNVEVLKGYCDSIRDECIRVVSGMPKWTPGSAGGNPVKVKYTLPIRFRLE